MKLPEGWVLSQADGTSWMAMYCLNLLGMALELASEDPVYEDVATKFWEHFVYIAHAIQRPDDPALGLWDEQDGFFYDEIHHADGRQIPIRVRSARRPAAPDRRRHGRFAAHRPVSGLQAAHGVVLRAPAGPDLGAAPR